MLALSLALPAVRRRGSNPNLLAQPSAFDNAAWSKTRLTVVADTATAPDGTLTAEKLVEDTSNNNHNAYQAFSSVAGTHTLSVYCKAGERTECRIIGNDGGSQYGAIFNLANGTAGFVSVGATSAILAAGNGWYRCVLTFPCASGAGGGQVRPANGGTDSYLGDGASGIYAWGAKLEAAASPSAYP